MEMLSVEELRLPKAMYVSMDISPTSPQLTLHV